MTSRTRFTRMPFEKTDMATFTRMQFEGLLSTESVFVANNDLDILTLLENGRIVAQEVFPTVVRDSGVAFVRLFWQHYPGIVTYDMLKEWFPTEAEVRQRTTRRLSRSTFSPIFYTYEIRKRLNQFGITIAGRPNVGYELRALESPPTRDTKRLEDIELPAGILDDGYTLTLNHEGVLQQKRRVLTLLEKNAIAEQCLLPPTAYALLKVFLANENRSISQHDLVMHYYGVKAKQAAKWLEDAKGNRAAHQQLMMPAWVVVSKLRKPLRTLGISLEQVRGYGYALGKVPTKARERVKR